MKYYALIDASNDQINAVYTEETLPVGAWNAELISKEDYFMCIDLMNKGYLVYYVHNAVAYKHPLYEDLAECKTVKLVEINKTADHATATLLKTYPESEIVSWSTQLDEARRYLSDPTEEVAATLIMLPRIAEERSLELLDLCQRVVYKHDLFSDVSGSIFGRRQKYEDELDRATAVDEVMSISPDYTDILQRLYTS